MVQGQSRFTGGECKVMTWIFVGFLLAIIIETVIRVVSNYENLPQKEQKKVQVSVPWYGWSLLGLLTWKSFKDDKKR